MVYLILFLLLVIMILRPLRKLFFACPTFFIPAAAGALVVGAIGEYVMVLAGTPWPYSFLIPGAMAVGAAIGWGEACKAWCDRTFGGRSQDRGRNGS
jgi:hypothetical protein